jgi:Ca-activated chloride channel family protein
MNPFHWPSVEYANPWLLWLLLLLPFLALLRSARGNAPAVLFSSVETLRTLGKPRRSRAGAWFLGLFLCSLGVFILGLARPRLATVSSRIEASGIDIMLALDVSRSMLAEDIVIGREQGNRIEAVKKLTAEFIAGRPNDRIGITAFAGRPYLVSPLTLDHDWLARNLERLRIGLVEDGTAIGLAIASSANRLKDRKDAKTRIVVLLTDGDNNAGKIAPIAAAEAAHTLGIKIYTVGVGSEGMASIPVPLPDGRTVYQQIPVQVDEPSLREIAKIGEGQYFRATDARSLQRIFEQIDQLEKTKVELSSSTSYVELFPWFVKAGLLLLLLSVLLHLSVWRGIP